MVAVGVACKGSPRYHVDVQYEPVPDRDLVIAVSNMVFELHALD